MLHGLERDHSRFAIRRRIETTEEIKANIRRSLSVLAPEQGYVDADCGLKTRTVAEAEAKLRVMVAAADEVRRELRLK